ncbi:MAG: hypothetical protein U0Q16_11790 [Bryobacteraceae bacterium]
MLPLALLLAACVAPKDACLERVTFGGRHILVYRNLPLHGDPQPHVQRAFVLVHGNARDADRYYRAALAAAAAAGRMGDTLLLAPWFKGNTGTGSCRDAAEANEAVWDCSGWKAGEAAASTSAAGNPVYSFDFMDTLLSWLDDRTRFPNLKEIVVGGHSAGGQFVQRYAAANVAEPKLRVPVRYVVANPSSYVYPNAMRLSPQGSCDVSGSCSGEFRGYWDAEYCTAFNQYRYGLDKLDGYIAKLSADQVRSQFAKRKVTYLVGELDTLADSQLDQSCASMAQGRNRRDRGITFWNYMRQQFHAEHELKVVGGCGHSAVCMFASQPGLEAVFGSAIE